MAIFYVVLFIVLAGLTGYLLGSVSFAVLITKYIYHIDIYSIGSGNAGGTNVGRAVGKVGAFSVIFLDAVKCTLPVWVWFFICNLTGVQNLIPAGVSMGWIYYTAGFTAAVGHTFPLYHHFKGGKAVSCYAGFVMFINPIIGVLGFSFFLLVYFLTKRVSIGSISTVIFGFLVAVAVAIFPAPFEWTFLFNSAMRFDGSYVFAIYMFIYAAYIVVRHRPNIIRIINKTEPETHYKKTK